MSEDDQHHAVTPQPKPKATSGSGGYEVGYGRPPVASRFKKGRSGNPRGRPKGSRSVRSLLEQVLSSPVTINEGGTTRVIEQRMALFKSMLARAIKGDPRSAALIIKLMDQFDVGAVNQQHQPITEIRRTIVRPQRRSEDK